MSTKPRIAVPVNSPYCPPRLSSSIVYAVKGLFAGKATEEQQGVFAEWLIAEVCKKDDMSFRPGGHEGDRDTCVAEGKRFVALSILKALNMPLDAVAAMRTAETVNRGAPSNGGDIERE